MIPKVAGYMVIDDEGYPRGWWRCPLGRMLLQSPFTCLFEGTLFPSLRAAKRAITETEAVFAKHGIRGWECDTWHIVRLTEPPQEKKNET